MPLLPWRSTKDLATAHYAVLGAKFIARQRGRYWYVCPTPKHAMQGMYGRFVVEWDVPRGRRLDAAVAAGCHVVSPVRLREVPAHGHRSGSPGRSARPC